MNICHSLEKRLTICTYLRTFIFLSLKTSFKEFSLASNYIAFQYVTVADFLILFNNKRFALKNDHLQKIIIL